MKPNTESARAFFDSTLLKYKPVRTNSVTGMLTPDEVEWTTELMQAYAKQCVDAALAEREAEKWIKCEDRLPDIGAEYIVAYDPKDNESPRIIETVAEYCSKSRGKRSAEKWYYIGSDAMEFTDVVAWQPLPEYTEQI